MRRLVLLLVVLILPLQLAWGAAAGYCQHEAGPDSQHFGHHEHVHKADPGKASGTADWGQDNDCGTCHAAGATALTSSAAPLHLSVVFSRAPILEAFRRPPAPPPHAPERPQWARLA